jgi:hypothetical protein
MPNDVGTAWWIALAAGWVVSASVFAWMTLRARRRLGRADPILEEIGRRTGEIFTFILGLCAGCELVLLTSGAPRAASTFWLLAIVPVAYAGLWITMGVMAWLWLRGWPPRPRPRP